MLDMLAQGHHRREDEHDPEEYRHHRGGCVHRDQRPQYGTGSSADLQEHPDPHIGNALADIGRSRPRGIGDRGDQRCTDRITNVHPQCQSQQRNDHHPASQARERTQKAGQDSSQEKNCDKKGNIHTLIR